MTNFCYNRDAALFFFFKFAYSAFSGYGVLMFAGVGVKLLLFENEWAVVKACCDFMLFGSPQYENSGVFSYIPNKFGVCAFFAISLIFEYLSCGYVPIT